MKESIQKKTEQLGISNSCLIVLDSFTASRAASSSAGVIVVLPAPETQVFAITKLHLAAEFGNTTLK